MENLYPSCFRNIVCRICYLLLLVLLLPIVAKAQHIQFERITSNITDDTLKLSHREEVRVERFLKRVYPTHSLERCILPRTTPLLRKARYDVVELQGMRYIIAGYVAEFEGGQLAHDLAIYRIEPQGPFQVWHTKSWRANYYGLNFETASPKGRIIVLFKEGGLDPSGFSLSGVFSFREGDTCFLHHDLTPRLPHLNAKTNFPGRALFGQKVTLQQTPDGDVILAASDQDFTVSNTLVTPTNFWKFNPKHIRFEPLKSEGPGGPMTSR
jgi:hypothetical protein